MPLLKIGDNYLNTDYIVEIYDDGTAVQVTTTRGSEKYFNAGADALRRWLDANATDIMTTPQPAQLPIGTRVQITVTNEEAVIIHSVDNEDEENYGICTINASNEIDWLPRERLIPITVATPQPAPADDAPPEPRKFKIGDTVVVTRKVIEDDWVWLGRSGRVMNTDGDNGYQVDFDGESAAMLEEQLALYDDTVPF